METSFKISDIKDKLYPFFWSRTQSERRILLVSLVAAIFVFFWFVIQSGTNYYTGLKDRAVELEFQHDGVLEGTRRYKIFEQRQIEIKEAFKTAELSISQVTEQLDRIVKNSIGKKQYDFSKTKSPVGSSFNTTKQDFTLRFKDLTLSEVVALLFNLEKSEAPLFLGKVDVIRDIRTSRLSLVINIFSIQKAT